MKKRISLFFLRSFLFYFIKSFRVFSARQRRHGANTKLLRRAQSLSETPILTDQVPYRLPDRTYVENGVLEYCQQNDILLTAYSPVKFRNLPVNKTVRAIAEAHSATPFQIALAWLVAQPRVITIPMSFNPQHIRENFEAAEIVLSEEEFKTLSKLY